MQSPILVLHGWRLNNSYYSRLIELLNKNGFQAHALDLPGFGKEPLVSQTMDLSDYVTFIKEYIDKKKWEKVVLIGHSFGGRVSLKYASENSDRVDTLILTGVPIIRDISFKKKVQFVIASMGSKTLRLLPKNLYEFLRKSLYYVIGEWDYYKSGELKGVFKNIISEDLIPYIKKITVPTVLVWGEKDTITPTRILSKVTNLNPKIVTRIIPASGHSVIYKSPEEFYKTIKEFL